MAKSRTLNEIRQSKEFQTAKETVLSDQGGKSSQRKAKIINGCSTTYVGNDVMFEQIGKTYIDYLDVDKNIAKRYLDRALNNAEISENQYNKIKMLCHNLNTITIR